MGSTIVIDSSRIATSTTSATNKIILFDSAVTSTGKGIDFSGYCIKRKIALQITGTNVRPFISTEYTNVKDIIPSDNVSLPVYGPTGIQVSPTWTGLWDGNIDKSFKEAGVLQGTTDPQRLSASTSSGNYDNTNNCNSWTAVSTSYRISSGDLSLTGSGWIVNSSITCNAARSIICVAW